MGCHKSHHRVTYASHEGTDLRRRTAAGELARECLGAGGGRAQTWAQAMAWLRARPAGGRVLGGLAVLVGLMGLPGWAETRVEAMALLRARPEGVMVQGAWVRSWASPARHRSGLPMRALEAGGRLAVNPAYGEAGLHLEAAPHPALALRVAVDGFRYSGHGGARMAFPGSDVPFEAETLARGKGLPGWGLRSSGTLRLQAEAAGLLWQAEGRWLRHHFGGAGPWVFEPELDTLVPVGGTVRQGRLTALAPLGRWKGGPTLDLTGVPGTRLGRRRMGGVAFRESALRSGGTLTVFLSGGVNLADPSRKGQVWAQLGAVWRPA